MKMVKDLVTISSKQFSTVLCGLDSMQLNSNRNRTRDISSLGEEIGTTGTNFATDRIGHNILYSRSAAICLTRPETLTL